MTRGTYIRTPEIRNKMRQASIGNKNNLGKKRSMESIENIRRGHLGKRQTDESKEKNRQSMIGKNLGKKRTPEQIENIRQGHLGLKPTPETKEKNRLAHIGKKRSIEACKNMCQSQIERYKDPKEREKTSQAQLHIFSALDRLIKNKYCPLFTDKLREQVRIRDGYICHLCGRIQLYTDERLSVHHIHYDKQNCYPDLISLCRSCNLKVNHNRNYWENYFMNILNNRQLLYWTKRRKFNE